MNGKKERLQYLRVVNSRMLYLSSGCAERIGMRADLYECGDVMALVGDPMGQFHLSPKSSYCSGVNLCAMELVHYLCKKYGVEAGGKLSVWSPLDETEQVVFITGPTAVRAAEQRFDKRFQKLELGYQKRYGDWVFVEDNCVSFSAGIRDGLSKRMNLHRSGDVLALLEDPEGYYMMQCRGGRKNRAIYSSLLAEYCRKEFGNNGRSVLFHARPINGGVGFSLQEEVLLREDIGRLPVYDLGLPRDRFLCFTVKNLYLSAQAFKLLGERFSLYESGEWLALRAETDGMFCIRHMGYQNVVYSKGLEQAIKRRYPEAKKLYFQEQEAFLVLTPQQERTEVPPARDFVKKELALRGRIARRVEKSVDTAEACSF